MRCVVLLLAAVPLLGGEPSIDLEIEAGPAADGPPWTVLTVRASTDLPDRAILSVFVYDESGDRPILLDQGRCEARGGECSIALARTKGPPLSGSYRAEVVFDPSRQRDAVIEAMKPPPKEERRQSATLTIGGPGDRERDIARERERLKSDLDALSLLVDELSARLAEAREKGFDRAAYASWQKGWAGRLEAREVENRDRPYVKTLRVAGLGQARHQGLVQVAREASEAPLSEAPPETLLAAALGGVEKFHARMQKVFEETGIVDASAVPRFDPEPFRALAAELAVKWAHETPDAAWLAAWRARWAQALAAALPALAPVGDQAASGLAEVGAGMARAGDAGAVARAATTLEELLATFPSR